MASMVITWWIVAFCTVFDKGLMQFEEFIFGMQVPKISHHPSDYNVLVNYKIKLSVLSP